MYHSYVMYFKQYYVSYFGDVCIDVTLSWYHIIILSIMMRWLGSNCILHRTTEYVIITRTFVAKPLLLCTQVDSVHTTHTLSRFEATDSGSNERMTIPLVPIFPVANRNDEGHLSLYWWGWHGHRLFKEQTTMKRARPLVALLIVTNTRTTY